MADPCHRAAARIAAIRTIDVDLLGVRRRLIHTIHSGHLFPFVRPTKSPGPSLAVLEIKFEVGLVLFDQLRMPANRQQVFSVARLPPAEKLKLPVNSNCPSMSTTLLWAMACLPSVHTWQPLLAVHGLALRGRLALRSTMIRTLTPRLAAAMALGDRYAGELVGQHVDRGSGGGDLRHDFVGAAAVRAEMDRDVGRLLLRDPARNRYWIGVKDKSAQRFFRLERAQD